MNGIGTMVIRADADAVLGVGHVARCLAMAQQWHAAGGRVVGVGHLPTGVVQGGLGRQLESAGVTWVHLPDAVGNGPSPSPESQDPAPLLRVLHTERPSWTVLDGYHFEQGYIEAIRESAGHVMVIDDSFRAADWPIDILLNPSPEAPWMDKIVPPMKIGLLGPRFLPLRTEFERRERETTQPRRTSDASLAHAHSAERGQLESDAYQIEPTDSIRLLVSVGGSDPARLTERVLDALAILRKNRDNNLGWDVRVVAGPANSRYSALADRADVASREESPEASSEDDPERCPDIEPGQVRVCLLREVHAMRALMDWADLALTAAGGTCWELAALRVPMLLVTVADNQRPSAQWLARHDAAHWIGQTSGLTPHRLATELLSVASDAHLRRRLSAAAGRAIDGRGAARVLAIMRGLTEPAPATSSDCHLRPIAPEDSSAVWRLTNDPTVRRWSLRSELITAKAHKSWFAERLADPGCLIWGLELAGLLVGSIRYQRELGPDGPEAIISFQVHSVFRGRGLGRFLLEKTMESAIEQLAVPRLTAFVLKENTPSHRCFQRQAFERNNARCTETKACYTFVVHQE